jgi:hypothetical protein
LTKRARVEAAPYFDPVSVGKKNCQWAAQAGRSRHFHLHETRRLQDAGILTAIPYYVAAQCLQRDVPLLAESLAV